MKRLLLILLAGTVAIQSAPPAPAPGNPLHTTQVEERIRQKLPPVTQRPAGEWKLVGLSSVGGEALAILSARMGNVSQYFFVRQGERFGQVEIPVVNVARRSVVLRDLKPNRASEPTAQASPIDHVLRLDDSADSSTEISGVLDLPRIPAGVVFDLYARWSGRSVLAGQTVRIPEITLIGQQLSKAEALALIEQKLAESRILLRPMGEKFVQFLPEGQRLPVLDARATAALMPVENGHGRADVNFKNMDVGQFLVFYEAEIVGRKIRSDRLPPAQITFSNQTKLTRDEMIYALAAVLELNGIRIVRAADGELEAVPAASVRP